MSCRHGTTYTSCVPLHFAYLSAQPLAQYGVAHTRHVGTADFHVVTPIMLCVCAARAKMWDVESVVVESPCIMLPIWVNELPHMLNAVLPSITALSGKMMAELAQAVDTLENWERGVAVTLQGAGGNFCSGADLSLAREHLVTGEDGRLMCTLMTDTLDRLRRCVEPQ